jgi:zinc protease
LFRKIRTEKGLAYGVGGGIGSAFDHPGILRLSMGTKSQSTVESIQALDAEMDDLAKHPIGDDEIQRAKDSILNSFVFNFDSPEKVLRERMAYEFYGYPADFLEKYRAGVEKVGKADVARVAAKYLHKDQLAVLVVGNTTEFDKPLASLGPVTNVDIAIPPPPGDSQEPAAKPAASNLEGKALAAKVVDAMGGEARLKTVKSVRVNITESESGDQPAPVEVTIVYPDRMHVNVQTPNGPLIIVVSPTAGFMLVPGMGARDIPAAQKTETMEQIKRDPIYLGQHLNDPAFSFAAVGTEKIGSVEAGIVDVSGPGVKMRWYVDPQTGRILRESYTAMGQSGQFQGETILENWETHDGLTLPRTHKNKQNGQESSVAEFNSLQINPAVDSKLFEKPVADAKLAK